MIYRSSSACPLQKISVLSRLYCRSLSLGWGVAVALLAGCACAAAPEPLPSGPPPPPAPATTAYAWKNVAITGGGFVTGIIFHPTERHLRYVRTDVGGAYRWDESTRRWVAITDWISGADWTLTGIESLALDPTDPDRVYLAAGSYTNNWSGPGAILRSADRGRTWERTPMPFKFGGNEDGRSNGERLAVDPRVPELLWLGTRMDGLWRSADHGATWAHVKTFAPPADMKNVGLINVFFDLRAAATVRAPAGAPTPVVYVAASSPTAPLWRSADAGATWSLVPGQPLGLRPHHAKFAADGTLYVTYGNEAGPNGVTDGAVWKFAPDTATWTDITPLKPAGNDRFGYAGLGLDAQQTGTLVVSTLCRWNQHDDLFRSTDGGATWARLNATATFDHAGVPFLNWGRPQPDLGHWIGDLEIDPFDSAHALYVTGMTVWGTSNLTAADARRGTAWSVRAHGIEETVINDLISPPAGAPLLSAMWDIDGFRHEALDTSPAAGFYQPNFNKSTAIDFAELRPDFIARVHGRGGAWSEDNGRTWKNFAARPAEDARQGTIAVAADGGTLVWTPERGAAHVSRDRGATWKLVSGLGGELRIVADRVRPSQYYALGRDGRVFASEDRGATFRPAGQVALRSGSQLRAVPGRAGHVWVVSGQGVFRSADAGVTFSQPAPEIRGERLGFGRAATDGAYPAIYVVGERGAARGVFRSTDAGLSWTQLNPADLQFNRITDIEGDPRVFGRVYLGTAGRGIFYGEPAARP